MFKIEKEDKNKRQVDSVQAFFCACNCAVSVCVCGCDGGNSIIGSQYFISNGQLATANCNVGLRL